MTTTQEWDSPKKILPAYNKQVFFVVKNRESGQPEIRQGWYFQGNIFVHYQYHIPVSFKPSDVYLWSYPIVPEVKLWS